MQKKIEITGIDFALAKKMILATIMYKQFIVNQSCTKENMLTALVYHENHCYKVKEVKYFLNFNIQIN